jgi:hypothetical protein
MANIAANYERRYGSSLFKLQKLAYLAILVDTFAMPYFCTVMFN